MTGYALNLWVFNKTHSAMTLSLMSFWMYLPYIIVSVFAGAFIDFCNWMKIVKLSRRLTNK